MSDVTASSQLPTGVLHILQHSLGLDQHGQGTGYRSHFVTGPESTDHPLCLALVAAGMMRMAPTPPHMGGMDFFRVTAAGRRYVAEFSPKPPKLTAGQRRYRDFLAADLSISFGEWLKRGWYKPERERRFA